MSCYEILLYGNFKYIATYFGRSNSALDISSNIRPNAYNSYIVILLLFTLFVHAYTYISVYVPWQIKIVGMFLMQVEPCNASRTGTYIFVVTPTGKVYSPVS